MVTTPPPEACTKPLISSGGSLSTIVAALSMLPAIVKEPPATISRVAPALMVSPATDSALFSVTLTGTRICTVMPDPGTRPSLQLGADSQLPPVGETHSTVDVGPANGGRVDVVVVVVVVVVVAATSAAAAIGAADGPPPGPFSASCVPPTWPSPPPPLFRSLIGV